jgi:pyruvate,water dikinase
VAVVARELGIPTVVQVKGATREIRTGMRVRVDGGAGLVTILEDAPEPHASGSALADDARELFADTAEATA